MRLKTPRALTKVSGTRTYHNHGTPSDGAQRKLAMDCLDTHAPRVLWCDNIYCCVARDTQNSAVHNITKP